ncbi:hypothetical protein M422DRAFT_239115 [Sphaerobolus stellatus SS14]|nr:hypothetical protein M422DRAFT_239115 [Sphaerobolus stellatus SS14]
MTMEANHLSALGLSLTEEQVKTDRIENQLNSLLVLLDPAGENAELALLGEAPSIQAMEGNAWFQGADSVDDYVDRYRELVFHLEYIDEANLVVKFKKGLNKSLQTTVATTDPVSDFDDLEAWIEAAQRVVDAKETSKVFEENIIQKPTPASIKPLSIILRVVPTTPTARSFNFQAHLPINPPVINSHMESTKALDGAIPVVFELVVVNQSFS